MIDNDDDNNNNCNNDNDNHNNNNQHQQLFLKVCLTYWIGHQFVCRCAHWKKLGHQQYCVYCDKFKSNSNSNSLLHQQPPT